MKRFTLVATLVVVVVLFRSGTVFGGSKPVTMLPCSNDPRYEDGSGSLSITSLRGWFQNLGGDWIRGYEYRIQYQFQGLPEGYYALSWISSRGGLGGSGEFVIYVSPDGTSSGTMWPIWSQYKLDYYFLSRVEWSEDFGWQRVDPYSALCGGP